MKSEVNSGVVSRSLKPLESFLNSTSKTKQKLNMKVNLSLYKGRVNSNVILPAEETLLMNPANSSRKAPKSKRPVSGNGGFEGNLVGLDMNGRQGKKRGMRRKAVRKADPGVFCVCKGIDDGIRSMIQCNKCKDWFHFECVNISEDCVPSLYRCSQCKILPKKAGKTQEAMSPLDLLILAVENDAKQQVFGEPKDASTASFDSDKTLDIELVPYNRGRRERSIENLLNREGNSLK
eukprot:TRINITY_DN6544_c0_g1_i2.p1 TRINITY_DN6544_c0_g1~~TRINITY_DN6544_c0_g1_i2.p1  ORF type:complete len:235 (-),score=27.13 TRINITY_DN6544_c0_g1_i2:291-995(-)